MKTYLFDSTNAHENLLPLSFTRPIADFRCGILTIIEKWQRLMPADYSFFPIDYLRNRFGNVEDPEAEALFIAGGLLPRTDLCRFIESIPHGKFLEKDGEILVFRGNLREFEALNIEDKESKIQFEGEIHIIKYVFDIFLNNGDEIKHDYHLVTDGRQSAPVPECVRTVCHGKHGYPVFIEEGATVECATFNTCEGPVYIGKDAILMEGACIRGPFALCEASEVRMGATIYEDTTIGPHCKVGGEVSHTVFFGYSNKAHGGYLGNAVIGEWCNIGAGTNASNLKNDYSLIRVWNYATQSFMRTDLQFCGLIMGDHSKVGVNCMLNTATVIGVGVNLHGAGFPRTFVPCFCEGSPGTGFSHVPLKKFMETAERVMSRRARPLTEEDKEILSHIYQKK